MDITLWKKDIAEASKIIPEPDFKNLDKDEKITYVFGKDRETRNVLSKYEMASLLGYRVDQLQKGAPVSSEVLSPLFLSG